MYLPENGRKQTPAFTSTEIDFVERMREAFRTTATFSDKLNELYRSGDTAALEEKVDDLAHTLALEDPEYSSVFQKLRAVRDRRGSKEREHDYIEQVSRLREPYKRIIVSEAGLPDEARFGEIESSRQRIGEILDATAPESRETAQDALRILGIASTNDKGEVHYTFPTNLVPTSVINKWETYLASVCKHTELVRDLSGSERYQDEVGRADKARRYAHDTATKDIHAILDFESRYGWDFLDTRKLLGVIRDSTYPDLKLTLDDRARKLIAAHETELAVVGALSDQSSID